METFTNRNNYNNKNNNKYIQEHFEDNQINALPVVNKNILEGLVTIQMLIKSLE